MAYDWNPDGPTWQPVDPETAAASLQIYDDAGGLLTGETLDVLRAQIRSGEIKVVADSWGHVMIGPESYIEEMIAKHERRGFCWDDGDNE